MDLVSLALACRIATGSPAPACDRPPAPPIVSARASGVQAWDDPIAEAARRFAIPESWIRAVMQAESDGRATIDGRPTTSRAGAMGLMQLMPETWAKMRALLALGDDPYDPRDNILAGAANLRAMADRFGYPGVFAAYNAGPDRFDDFLRRGTPLPAETRAYLAAVTAALGSRPLGPTIRSASALFFPLGERARSLFDTMVRNDCRAARHMVHSVRCDAHDGRITWLPHRLERSSSPAN
jgi:soluble lytic murein transglycosylase-like protein